MVAPLFIGLATVVVPLQVGAANIAFPRAALAAFWAFLVGAGITVVAVFFGGGWGAVDGVTSREAEAIALTLLGTGMVIVALLLASICVATTVVSLRTDGMTLLRVPLFAWSMLVASAVWLLTLPVVVANIVLVYVDLQDGPLVFGNPEGSTDIIAQLAWVAEQPQVFAFAIPALGIIGSILPVVAGARSAHHSRMATLISLFALLSIGGWSQPFFRDNTEEFVFILFGLAIVLPVIGLIASSIGALAAADAPTGFPAVHLLGAASAGVLLLTAVVCGALRVVEPFDLGGTSVVTGVLNLVAFAAVTAAFTGLWFWAPKVGGVLWSAGAGRLAVLALVTGGSMLGLVDVVAGFSDAGDLMINTSASSVVDALGDLTLAGAVIGALGAVVALGALVNGRFGPAAAADPWQGHTLEWTTASPPPLDNFTEPLPVVVSEAPLLDRVEDEAGDDSTDREDAR